MFVELADTLYVIKANHSPTTGALTDPSVATAKWFEDGAAGSTSGVTVTSPFDSVTGQIKVAIVCSGANGFELGKRYSVMLYTTTGGVDSATEIANFQIVAAQNVAGYPVADMTHISADSTAADNLELQFDGTGLSGDNFPARQDEVRNIAATSAAVNDTFDSRTITTGSGAGGVTNTKALDGTYDALSDTAGVLDFYYQADVSDMAGGLGVGVVVLWQGYLAGIANTLKVYAYNWVTVAFEQVGTLIGVPTAVISAEEWELTSAHTGTGGNVGLVRIRFQSSFLSAATLNTDRIIIGVSAIPPTVAAIQSGLATSAALATVQADTDDIQTRIPAALTAGGNMKADALKWNGLTTVALPLVPTTPGNTLDVSATGEAGIDWANVGSPTTTLGLSGTTIKTATDIATATTAIKAKTDSLTFTVANHVDANTTHFGGTVAPAPSVAGVPLAEASVTFAGLDAAFKAALGVVRQNTAQAGAGAAEIALDASASSVDDTYAGMVVYIYSGTGIGQERTALEGYDGTTKRLPVDHAWVTNPDATSLFMIFSGKHTVYGSAKNLLDTAVENSLSLGDLQRIMVGVLAGTVADFTTDTLEFMSLDGTKIRVRITTADEGRAASVVVDPT